MEHCIATVVDVTPLVGSYLLAALAAGGVMALLLRRVVLGAAIGAILVMIGSALLGEYLPGHYWAYANDFIIEPFYCRGRVLLHPFEAVLSLVFHVGAPVLLVWSAAKMLQRMRVSKEK